MVVKTYFSQNRSVYNYIIDQPTTSKSFSAHLLLKEKLWKLDPSKNWRLNGNRYNKFRKRFLKKHMNQYGKLTCIYCGRNDLIIGFKKRRPQRNEIEYIATIDHIYPISKGGDRYDENNCCVACPKCNMEKADS